MRNTLRPNRLLGSHLVGMLVLLLTLGLLASAPAQAEDTGVNGAAVSTAAAATAKSGDQGASDQSLAKPNPKFRPKFGASFNNPFLGRKAESRNMNRVKAAVNNARKNSIIRIALYSFSRQDLATSLLNACQRGVTVQMVLNDNTITKQMKRVRAVLGTNQKPHVTDACHPRERKKNPKKNKPYKNPSFFKICAGACRIDAPKGNQHIKMYLFSHTGASKNVVMFGSNNLATFAADTHWNDLFTMREKPQFFADFSHVFAQLAADKPMAEPYALSVDGKFTAEFGAKAKSWGPNDPVIQRLDKIGCNPDPAWGVGVDGKTMIRVAMYAWAWQRGVKVANKVADLARRGCDVKVILSSPGARVVGILRRAGVDMRTADRNLDHNLETGFDETPFEKFTHEKWLTVNGTYDGKPARILWTGSENWSTLSLFNDELTVTIPLKSAVKAYNKHFNFVWRKYTIPMSQRYLRLLTDPTVKLRSTLE